MKTLKDTLDQTVKKLTATSSTPRLDAELLIASILQRSRSWLLAHFDEILTSDQLQTLDELVSRRAAREPMAYLLGVQEFWGLKFNINPDVLVPRPETEHIIEWVLARFPEMQSLSVADLGTGSGAIALALAFERPLWRIEATDHSAAAIEVAQKNAAQLELSNVQFHLGNWCQALPPAQKYALIVSNPPYIPEEDPHLELLTHEPIQALSAGADGLDAIHEIIIQAPSYLTSPGYLVLEHGYDQATKVTKLLRQYAFTDIQSHRDLAQQPRFVTAMYLAPELPLPRPGEA